MSKQFTLYGGEVTGLFQPDSRYRYVITDPVAGLKNERVVGVTTLLGNILDKPGLRLWARDEMAKMAFGMQFVDKKAAYNSKMALLQPGKSYSEDELQVVLDKSFNAYTIKTERGKDIGTMTHDFVAQYLLTNVIPTRALIKEAYPEAPVEFVSSVLKATRCFIEWWESLPDKELLGAENIIYSRKFKFSGTYDIKARIGDKIMMLDVKTTNRSQQAPLGIYPEYFLQLGGYMGADYEENGTLYDDCGVINVGKDGRLNIALASDFNMTAAECINAFVGAVQIHNWLNKLSKLTADSKFKSSLEVDNEKLLLEVEKIVEKLVKEKL